VFLTVLLPFLKKLGSVLLVLGLVSLFAPVVLLLLLDRL
jgi:hypothetical protein